MIAALAVYQIAQDSDSLTAGSLLLFHQRESLVEILEIVKPSNDYDNDYDDDDEYEARASSNAADLIGQHRAPLQLALQPSPLLLQPYKENITNIWMFLCWHFKVALSQSVTTTKGR